MSGTRPPLLVVVQGAPASGKTTLSQRLERDLHLPLIAKDDIKEFLFDRLEQSDREFSRIEGEAAVMMMYAAAKVFLKAGRSILMESAYYTEFSKQDISMLLKETNARYFEVYVHCDEDERRKRFVDRAHGGSRHPGHLDHLAADPHDYKNANLSPEDRYQRIGLGEYIDIDTTDDITDDLYASVLAAVEERL